MFFFSGTHVRTVRTSGYAPTIIVDAVQCKMFMKFMNLCQISFLLDWTMQNLEQQKKGFNNIPIILTYSALTVTVPHFDLQCVYRNRATILTYSAFTVTVSRRQS